MGEGIQGPGISRIVCKYASLGAAASLPRHPACSHTRTGQTITGIKEVFHLPRLNQKLCH